MINIQKLFDPHWSILPTLVLFGPHWSYSVQFVHLVQFSRHWSYLFLLGPHWSTLFYLVHFGPIRSSLFPFCHIFIHSVHFVPFGPFVFTSSIFVHFHTGKNMFRLIVPILNPNLLYMCVCVCVCVCVS